ncbi:MAG: response regulator transcription factor [Rickettsiales bacterium]|nr:response regulator transcription factor [Rickettsiales bacterium]
MNEKKFKILVIDDDKRIRELLQQLLEKNGFIASISADTSEAREQLNKAVFDLLVLDLMMPDESGIEFLTDLRTMENNNIPAIMLTAMGDIENKVQCFENGCNDYLVKPFEPKELILRINNLLKNNNINNTPSCEFGEFSFNFEKQILTKNNEVVYLTDIETKLLNLLCKNINKTLSREDLLFDELNERSIDVSIARLRKKIETNSKTPKYLRTVRLKGYILND